LSASNETEENYCKHPMILERMSQKILERISIIKISKKIEKGWSEGYVNDDWKPSNSDALST
jgi:hypothetical protein